MNENTISLDKLPSEVVEQILFCDTISFIDLCRLSRVSHFFNSVVKNNRLWRSKFVKIYSSSVSLYNAATTDWRYEFRRRHECQKAIFKKLQEMAIEFYHSENVSSEQFVNFIDVCPDHSLAVKIIIDELWHIVSDESHENLTIKYYAKRALRYMRHTYLERVWLDFLEGDKNNISLIKGACLLSQWCQPTNMLCTSKVSESINEILKLVFEEVQKVCPSHPLIKQELPVMVNETGKVLQISQWEPHHCKIILRAISEVMFNQLKYYGNTDIFTYRENNYIDKVLATKSGIPLTLCIVYETVASHLGVACLPVSFPGHFLLKWLEHPNFPGSKAYTYIDVYDNGTFKTVDELTDLVAGYENLSSSWAEAVSPHKVFTTMCWNLVEIARQQDGEGKGLLSLCNTLELLSILTPCDREHKMLLARVYLHLCINMARVISLLQEITEQDPTSTGLVGYMYRSAITSLETQRLKIEERKIKCTPRNKKCDVKFAVGMIMKHKKYNYRCVIQGWDAKCAASRDWITQMGVYELEHQDQQPFYMVLVEDGSNRYAAQENLVKDCEMNTISHPDIGRYFKSFHGSYYLPNEQKEQEYPDDNEVREQALSAMEVDGEELQ